MSRHHCQCQGSSRHHASSPYKIMARPMTMATVPSMATKCHRSFMAGWAVRVLTPGYIAQEAHRVTREETTAA